jgi:hypothetical protein
VKTFKNFILEAEDSRRKAFDNLPGEFQQKPKSKRQIVSPVERLNICINATSYR